MPDISMCRNFLCPSKDKCYRFRAVPSEFRQSYAGFKLEEKEDKCSHFWEITKEDKLTPLKEIL